MSEDTFFINELGIGIPEFKHLKEFLTVYCDSEIYELLNDYPEKRDIRINLKDVRNFSEGLEQALINRYEDTINILKTALLDIPLIQGSVFQFTDKDIDIKVNSLPAHYKKPIRAIVSRDINKLICIEGFVKARAFPKPKIVKAAFKCLRCEHITYTEQTGLKPEEPFDGCENDTCRKSGPFKLIVDKSEFVDFQAIKVQEFPDAMKGTKPYDIVINLENELTGKLEAGDRVSIIGVLESRQIIGKEGKSCLFEYILKAVSIEKLDTSFEELVLTDKDKNEVLKLSENPDIKELIFKSLAPSIYGYEDTKEALALQLFSGVRKVLPDGTILRGNINIALIGDPSTAKSQLVRYTTALSPRGVFTSGRSVSAAGLTAAVVKDDLSEGFTLEGGAAVVASGGILGIDEIGQARKEDKSALHEVMEQGTVTISKAGILATLKAECSVLAAGNPREGYFNTFDPLAEQIDIPPALWTRFDVIFTIFDKSNKAHDKAIAEHVLSNHKLGAVIQNREKALNPTYSLEDVSREGEAIEAPIKAELLKKYIAYARAYIFPVSSQEVTEAIESFYTDVRSMKSNNGNSPVTVTIRHLEALQRLSEASARMRLSNTITLEDVNLAKKLIIKSLKDIGYSENGTLDASLLLGLQSTSQRDNIKHIKDYSRKGKTEGEIIELMEAEHRVKQDYTKGLIKHLKEKSVLAGSPEGLLISL